MKKAGKSAVAGLILGLGLVGCGAKKDQPEEVNVKDLAWVDNNATLRPGRSIALDGDVKANTNAIVSFALSDRANNQIKQDPTTLRVVNQSPPAGKNSFSLADDMKVSVAAGEQACNGDYVLNVKLVAGRSNVIKPMYFKVEDGQDCRPALNDQSRRGVVHNVLGPHEGAFDLLKGQAVAKTEADTSKDLLDLTKVGSSSARGGFRGSLGSGNGARFIVNADVTYEAANGEAARRLFRERAGDRVSPALRTGDIVFVKLAEGRAQDAIYVLKITRVDPTADPSARGTNGGVIEFDYRPLQ